MSVAMVDGKDNGKGGKVGPAGASGNAVDTDFESKRVYVNNIDREMGYAQAMSELSAIC